LRITLYWLGQDHGCGGRTQDKDIRVLTKLSTFITACWRWCFSPVGLYISIGGCTTLLNFVLFVVFFRLGLQAWLANLLAWWPSVVFAWWTNRMWVFDAKRNLPATALFAELVSFTGSRLATGIADIFLIWLTVDLLSRNELLMKVLVGILVVAANYFISKRLIFTSKENHV